MTTREPSDIPAPVRILTMPAVLPRTLQELPPEAAHLCLRVANFLSDELAVPVRSRHLVVALSGGADSTALLLILFYLRQRLGITLGALHVDHGLRPESLAEAAAVAHFCQRLEIPCLIRREAVSEQAAASGTGTEEAGRTARYRCLQEALPDSAEDWYCTGHHLDDLTEDVLMRLIRGSGWPALGGMVAKDERRRILRPLLTLSRGEIEQFLEILGVQWTEDASNKSHAYRRNRIRHTILPLILEENPGFRDQMLSLWRLAGIDADYWNNRLDAFFSQEQPADTLVMTNYRKELPDDGQRHPACAQAQQPSAQQFPTVPRRHMHEEQPSCITLHRHDLVTRHQAERLRLYKAALDASGLGQIRTKTLMALDRAWLQGRGRVTFQFPGGKTATIRQGSIIIAQGKPRMRG